MELTIDEKQMKELLKEVMVELIKEKQGLFMDLMLEVIEEVGLANAIKEGRRNEFVSEDSITTILEGQE